MAETPQRSPSCPNAKPEDVTQWLCPKAPAPDMTHHLRFATSGRVYCQYCRTRRGVLVTMLQRFVAAEKERADG